MICLRLGVSVEFLFQQAKLWVLFGLTFFISYVFYTKEIKM